MKRRRELRVTQEHVADQLRVSFSTVLSWEKGKTEPSIEAIPEILSFLAYNPFPERNTLPEVMLGVRRAQGWSIREAAHRLAVDEGTWALGKQVRPPLRFDT